MTHHDTYKAALEAARGTAKVAWLSCPFGEIADADSMNELCEYIAEKIAALPSPTSRPTRVSSETSQKDALHPALVPVRPPHATTP